MTNKTETSSQQVNKVKVKVVIVGESGVGKTSICYRYIRDKYDANEQPTVGVAYLCKDETIGNDIYEINVWDTAGQER